MSNSIAATASLAMMVVVLGLWPQNAEAYNEFDKYLIVSSSVTHQIAYSPISQQVMPGKVQLRTLISSGLTYPQGMAVDPWRKHLYVADPTLGKLVYYVLDPYNEETLYVGPQQLAAAGVEVRWVSVDSLGNVYFTVESTQQVMRITAGNLDKGITVPEVVFEGAKNGMVSAPGGIAIDNYFAYWTNKLNPEKAGTIVRGFHGVESATTDLANTNVKSYGVCMAVDNVFFTAENSDLYGISRLGGNKPVTVSSAYGEPRGCAWDGQNNVYVADKKQNAVFAFPANMPSLRENLPRQLIAYMEGAYGVAVYTVSASAPGLPFVVPNTGLSLSPSLIMSLLLPAMLLLLASL